MRGDNLLSRLARYILVGVSIGYLGALAIQHVLRPRLFVPVLNSPLATLMVAPQLWFALLLGLLLIMAGIERMVAQTHATMPASRPLLHQADGDVHCAPPV